MTKARDLAQAPNQSFSFKNRIINGDFRVDQRNNGSSFTVGNLGYGLDRWLTQAVSASGTGQRVTGSTGNNNALRITGASGNTTIQVSQRIEAANIYDCASQTVTVSFTLYGSASGSVSVRFLYPTATDNYTSVTEPVGGTTVNFTTTPTTYTVTRTLDSNANKGVWVLLDFGAVGAGVTRTIEFFQLEKGSTATSFDYRPYGTELNLCYRYYQQYSNPNIKGVYAQTNVVSRCGMPIPTMRAAPTVSIGGTYAFYDGSTILTGVGSLAQAYSNVNAVELDFASTGSSGSGVVGRIAVSYIGGGSSPVLYANAEL